MPRQDAISEPTVLDDQLCFALYSAMHALTKAYAPLLSELGLTYPQYLVMLVLGRGEALSVTAIGEHLHLDSGTLTPLLKRLALMGLVARDRNPADERVVMVSLTARGRALCELARPVPRAMAGAMGLGAEHIGRLRDELLRLRTHLIESRRAA